MRLALFPGQGVRTKDVLDALPPDHGLLERASEILGYDLRGKVVSHSKVGRGHLPTWLAQPAIFVAGVISYRERVADGAIFDWYAGHSLGEYTALAAAGSLSFDDGVRLLDVRGRTMQKASLAEAGGMIAVLGLSDAEVSKICREAGISVANHNAPGQLVLSGTEAGLGRASSLVGERGGRSVLLEVGGAFHSEAMTSVRLPLQDRLYRTRVKSWSGLVISNVTARPYRTPGEVRKLLVEQVTSPVLFRESLEWAFEHGITASEDLGPGTVVGALADRTFNAWAAEKDPVVV